MMVSRVRDADRWEADVLGSTEYNQTTRTHEQRTAIPRGEQK